MFQSSANAISYKVLRIYAPNISDEQYQFQSSANAISYKVLEVLPPDEDTVGFNPLRMQ